MKTLGIPDTFSKLLLHSSYTVEAVAEAVEAAAMIDDKTGTTILAIVFRYISRRKRPFSCVTPAIVQSKKNKEAGNN